MTPQLSLEETETVIQQTAADRSTWHISTEDVVFQRKMEKIGIEPVYTSKDGIFKEYDVPANYIGFRKPRVLSEERKAQLAQQLRKG